MTTFEAEIQKNVRVELSRSGVVAFRNTVGVAWIGEFTRLPNGAVLLKRPRRVEFGLCVGSSDLIGYRSITITPEMIGKRVAVFLAAECKTMRGRPTDKQNNFINSVKNAGGIAFIARSAEDVIHGVDEWMRQRY